MLSLFGGQHTLARPSANLGTVGKPVEPNHRQTPRTWASGISPRRRLHGSLGSFDGHSTLADLWLPIYGKTSLLESELELSMEGLMFPQAAFVVLLCA